MNFRMLQLPPRVKFITLSGQPVDQARNMIVENAAGEWLFFLDSDVICPADTIPRLMATAKRLDAKIVSGLYYRRSNPLEGNRPVPGMYRWFPEQITEYGRGGHRAILDFKPGDVVEADVVGAGCLLINMEVFRTVPKSAVREWYLKHYGDIPLFHTVPDGWFVFGPYIKSNQMSEDFIALHAMKEYGYKCFVDTSVLCKHVLPFSVGIEGFQAVDAG